jgi:adenylate cyclase
MRRPISLKIFSIALGLLALMGIVTGIGAFNLRKVNDEVQALSDYYIPLEQSMSRVEIALRSQINHLERLLLLEQSRPRNAKAIDDEISQFEMRGKDLQQEVDSSSNLVAQAVARGSAVDQIELALLRKELPDIVDAHRHLQDTVQSYLKEARAGDPRALALLLDSIVEERDRVDKEVRDVTNELDKVTSTSAQKASRLELEALRVSLGITLAAAILGTVFAALITRNLVRPVRDLLRGTREVEQGNLSIQVKVSSADEIASLADSFNHMVGELRQKEQIKETFGRYLDPRIVKVLLEEKQLAQIGEKRVMTVFFSDLEGFTSFGEQLTPDAVVRFLNHYFTLMSEPIRARHGVIDKYIGDAIMAFWGPPFTGDKEHATEACLTALEQFERLKDLRSQLPDIVGIRKGLPELGFRVGIATGDVTVGNIGSETTRGYTVIGDNVNLASRLEAANKEYGTRALISEVTRDMAADAIETREIDLIRVPGKQEPARVFELLARKGGLDAHKAETRDLFGQGLAAYRRRAWREAEESFETCLQKTPEDAPSKLFLARVRQFQESPPRDDWDGVWILTKK